MDMLNLMPGTPNSAGTPLPAEPIAGQSAPTSGQMPAAFGDALLGVIEALALSQGQPATRTPTVSAQPLAEEDSEDTLIDMVQGDTLLKTDAQQQLLETLLMTSQTPTHTASYTGQMASADGLLLANLSAPQAPQTLTMAPGLLQPHLAATAQSTPGVDTGTGTLPAAQPVSAALMATFSSAAPGVTTLADSATPASTAAPSAPVTTLKMEPEPSRWSQQLQSALGERLQVQVKEQIQHATIRLDPPEMGKIDITMQVDNGRVQVQINASHGEVYRALQQTSNELRQSLTEQNFVQVEVQVSSQSGGRSQQGKEHYFAEQHNAIQAGAEIAGGEPATRHRREDDSVLLTV